MPKRDLSPEARRSRARKAAKRQESQGRFKSGERLSESEYQDYFALVQNLMKKGYSERQAQAVAIRMKKR